jgi:hypothetical protein
MSDDPNRHSAFLSIFLALLVASGVFLFLVVISGGFFFYLLLVMLAVAAFGGLHYLLWGRAMTGQPPAEEGQADDPDLRPQ